VERSAKEDALAAGPSPKERQGGTAEGALVGRERDRSLEDLVAPRLRQRGGGPGGGAAWHAPPQGRRRRFGAPGPPRWRPARHRRRRDTGLRKWELGRRLNVLRQLAVELLAERPCDLGPRSGPACGVL